MNVRTKDRQLTMRQTGEINMTNGNRRTGSFVNGLANLITIANPEPKHFLRGPATANSALRADFERIGSDMFKAVNIEKSREKAAS
jgi:hypothetical protein